MTEGCLTFRISEFRVLGLGFKVQGSYIFMGGSGCRVQSSGFKI